MAFDKVDAPREFPGACICGSQKGPLVATGLYYRAAPGPIQETAGHVYLCRMCTTRAARALGLVKGNEYERLQNASDELAQAEVEIQTRQDLIDKLTVSKGEAEGQIVNLKGYIETLQAEITHHKAFANQMAGLAKDMVST